MLDTIVRESLDATVCIRSAEQNITDQKYACSRLIAASKHLNVLMHVDNYMYELLRKEYVRVCEAYEKKYHMVAE